MLVLAGIILVALGLAIQFGVPLGRLPGDIVVKRGNATFYFPIVTCIVVSVLLSVIGYGQASLVSAGLYYLVASTLSLAAFMLLREAVERIRSPGAAMLALTMEAFAVTEEPDEPLRVYADPAGHRFCIFVG